MNRVAVLCRRLPLTRTSNWSPPRPRSDKVRTAQLAPAPLFDTLIDGTSVPSRSRTDCLPLASRSFSPQHVDRCQAFGDGAGRLAGAGDDDGRGFRCRLRRRRHGEAIKRSRAARLRELDRQRSATHRAAVGRGDQGDDASAGRGSAQFGAGQQLAERIVGAQPSFDPPAADIGDFVIGEQDANAGLRRQRPQRARSGAATGWENLCRCDRLVSGAGAASSWVGATRHVASESSARTWRFCMICPLLIGIFAVGHGNEIWRAIRHGPATKAPGHGSRSGRAQVSPV